MRAPRVDVVFRGPPRPPIVQRAPTAGAPGPPRRAPPRSPRACRCRPASARRRSPRQPAGGPARSLPSAPVPLHAAELVEEGRREGTGSRARPGRPARRSGARSSGRPPRAGGSPGAPGAADRRAPPRPPRCRAERVEPRPERRRLSLGVARVHHGPNRHTGQGARDGLGVPAETTTVSSSPAARTCSTATRISARPSGIDSVSFCRPMRLDAPAARTIAAITRARPGNTKARDAPAGRARPGPRRAARPGLLGALGPLDGALERPSRVHAREMRLVLDRALEVGVDLDPLGAFSEAAAIVAASSALPTSAASTPLARLAWEPTPVIPMRTACTCRPRRA